ncbi:MAG: FAD-dependent oxidoreductase [Candidatus Hydrogenedentes bacterium]|nr:FAD-dependent oxidoreductase [Candidatus Hydrogenedentota bacterium]
MAVYKYVIVGGGLSGGSAVEGIREIDKDGPILMMGGEKYEPYHRPPLTKQLWFKKKQVKDIFVHDMEWYSARGVNLLLGTRAVGLDARECTVADSSGRTYAYEKLLLATGGYPRVLGLPGGDLPGVCYFRTLDDFLTLQPQIAEGTSVLVIGGGFIGSEISAALNVNKANVTMLFPSPYLVDRVFPESLGRAITEQYRIRGVNILANDAPVSIEKDGELYVTRTRNGDEILTDLVVAGIGIVPGVELARDAGIQIEDGIVVDEQLASSAPDVYAAGDNARFPYAALGRPMRVEHWDNALNQGKVAGRNMAGASESYTYMPYFFSDLFEFGYEAVGDVNSKLETYCDWIKENDTGVIYYLADGQVRGAMMCNVWDRVPDARELILKGEVMAPAELAGAVR